MYPKYDLASFEVTWYSLPFVLTIDTYVSVTLDDITFLGSHIFLIAQ